MTANCVETQRNLNVDNKNKENDLTERVKFRLQMIDKA